MKRRFTEEQIIGILREQVAGGTIKEITRRRGVTEPVTDQIVLALEQIRTFHFLHYFINNHR